MTIYIDPCWAGFAVGTLFSTVCFVGLFIYIGIKYGKKKGE